jgi:catechol 2,3-dioxygenase-like lactoylglutathione lyase family enzyme
MSEFRWDHLHLRSPDPEATAQYYVDVFGATPGNYPEFRVWAGMMGGKEPPHAKTQRTSYP